LFFNLISVFALNGLMADYYELISFWCETRIKAPGGVLAAEPVPGLFWEDGGMSEFRAKY
jgi:hypothetical protein